MISECETDWSNGARLMEGGEYKVWHGVGGMSEFYSS